MPYHVCIDIGGTFTDCLVSDDNGTIAIFKSPTTPGEFEKGFINVLGVAAEDLGLAARDFISQIDIIVHGSTVSTNALVEGKTARAGLIVNHGHADILTLREGPRKGAFEWRLDYPDPYIPRKLTRTVRGRIDVRGREIERVVNRRCKRRCRTFWPPASRIRRSRLAVVGGQSGSRTARP